MMDEVSYYGTLVAMLSLQLLLFWLFKYDQNTRRLTEEEIKADRLAMVPACSAQRSIKELRTRHEELGFLVFEVRFIHHGPSSFAAEAVQLSLLERSPAEQCQRAVHFIVKQLASRDLKLHAYISLPGSADLSTGQSVEHCSLIIQILRDRLLPPYQLLAAFSGPIGADRSRVICLNTGPSRSGLIRLAPLVEQTLFKYLREEVAGQNLIEVDSVSTSQRSIFGAVRSLMCAMSRLTKCLLSPRSAALLYGWLDQEGTDAISLETSEDARSDRAVDRTIKDLVLLVYPQPRTQSRAEESSLFN